MAENPFDALLRNAGKVAAAICRERGAKEGSKVAVTPWRNSLPPLSNRQNTYKKFKEKR